MGATQTTFAGSIETYRSITRPVIYDSIISVLKYFGLDGAKNVYFNGEAEITKLIGSDFGNDQSQTLYTDGIFRNKVYAVAAIEPSEFNNGYHNQRRDATEMPFWLDKSIGMYFTPEFAGRTVTVELNSHFTSRIAAQEFVNKINYTTSQMLTMMTFDGEGHLPLNDGILELMSDVHALLVTNKIRADQFPQYLVEKKLRDFTIINNVAGNNSTLVYPIKLRDMQIEFEEPQVRLAQKGQTMGKYEVGVAYKFFYNEFIGWRITYPLQVHQDEIPSKWVVTNRDLYNQSVPYHGAANPEYVAGVRILSNMGLTQAPYYLVLPHHDNWEREHKAKLNQLIQVRLRVDDVKGEQLLCNLFEIPEFQWDDDAKAYLLRRHDKVFTRHETPIHFEVYSDDLQVEPNQLRMDEVGNIFIKREPTVTRLQHLIINIDYAVEDYSTGYWEDARENGGGLLPNIYPWWDWDNLPDNWQETIPDGLPIDVKRSWNNYEMELGLIVKNIKTFRS